MKTLTERISRLFLTPDSISACLRQRYKPMPPSRVVAALSGEDEEARRWIEGWVAEEEKRDDLGIFMRTLRLAAGVPAGEVAEKLKRTRVTMHNNESGKNSPGLEVVNKFILTFAPPDRERQLSDLARQGKFDLYLDVLHAIY